METKFTQLVKIKKQKVLECQKRVIQNNYDIALTKEKCEIIKDEILQIKTPENGTFKEMLQAQEIKRIHTLELDGAKRELAWLESQKRELEEMLKECMMDHEKAKHLDDIEIERAIKESQRRELNRINEVAMMLYNNKNRSTK